MEMFSGSGRRSRALDDKLGMYCATDSKRASKPRATDPSRLGSSSSVPRREHYPEFDSRYELSSRERSPKHKRYDNRYDDGYEDKHDAHRYGSKLNDRYHGDNIDARYGDRYDDRYVIDKTENRYHDNRHDHRYHEIDHSSDVEQPRRSRAYSREKYPDKSDKLRSEERPSPDYRPLSVVKVPPRRRERESDHNEYRNVYADIPSRDLQMPTKVRRVRSPEPAPSIGEVMAGVFYNSVAEKDFSSEKRLFKLVSKLKKHSAGFSLDAKQLQMIVEKFLEKMIAEKNWTAMTVEKALLLCATLDQDLPEEIEGADWYDCKFCELSHPPGKFQCSLCGEKFQHEVFLQAHKMTSHNSAAVFTGMSLICEPCGLDFNQDPRQLAIHIREKHMCQYNHIECPKRCGDLIVERNIDSVVEHIAEKHECEICHDAVTKQNYSLHKFTFHGIPQDSLIDNVGKILASSGQLDLIESEREAQELVVQRDLSQNELNQIALNEAEMDNVPHPDQGKFTKCQDCELRVPFGGYKCPDCSQMFVYKVQLFLHFRDFHRKLSSFSLFCEICGKLEISLDSLLLHVIKEGHECKSEHLQCAYGCVNLFRNLGDLAMHNDEEHEFFCQNCKTVVAVNSKSEHVKNCIRGIRNLSDESQTPPENVTEKCIKCSFKCSQSVAFMCEICAMSGNREMIEFVDEIEWTGHILKEHKNNGAAFRDKTLTCSLCTIGSNDDVFDILSFLHHRKMFHSICDTHIRCRNRPCNVVLPQSSLESTEHFSKDCEFKFDLTKASQVEIHYPSWKMCKNCSYIAHVGSLTFCDFCPSSNRPSFITKTEFVIHLFRVHGILAKFSPKCALCRTDFNTLEEFVQHRTVFHQFCAHHSMCPKNSDDCAFLFGLERTAITHANNEICAAKLQHGRRNRSKYCNSCSAFFKLSFVNVCYFCPERPAFVSENEFLFHLLTIHDRKVAGNLTCADCSLVFEEPVSWHHHSIANHARCPGHQFCPNSMECFTVFPANEATFSHACNYDSQPFANQQRFVARDVTMAPCLPSNMTHSAAGREQFVQPEPVIRVEPLNVPLAPPRSLMSFPPPQDLFTPLFPGMPLLPLPSVGLPTSHTKEDSESKSDRDGRVVSREAASKSEKAKPGDPRDPSQHLSYAERKKLYEKLLVTSDQLFYCKNTSYISKNKRNFRYNCMKCHFTWFLHSYDYYNHASSEHGREYKGSGTFECDACDDNDKKFVTKDPRQMARHRLDSHNLKPFYLCTDIDCSQLFENSDSVRRSIESKEKKCVQIFDKEFAWSFRTKTGTMVKPLSSVKREFYIISCKKCPFELKISSNTLFTQCKICHFKPQFAQDDERFWHMAIVHEKEREQKSDCRLCRVADENDNKVYSVQEKSDHFQSVHGFCRQHFVCPFKNCYFVTSDVEEYIAHKKRPCRNYERPQHCTIIPGAFGSFRKLVSSENEVSSSERSQEAVITVQKKNDISMLTSSPDKQVSEITTESREPSTSKFVSPKKEVASSIRNNSPEKQANKATSSFSAVDDSLLAEKSQVELKSEQNSAHETVAFDHEVEVSNECDQKSNWDDMMSNMIQYTDELMEQKEEGN